LEQTLYPRVAHSENCRLGNFFENAADEYNDKTHPLVLVCLQEQMLEVDLFRENRAIVGQGNAAYELT